MYNYMLVKLRNQDWKRYKLIGPCNEDDVYNVTHKANQNKMLSVKIVEVDDNPTRTKRAVLLNINLREVEEFRFV